MRQVFEQQVWSAYQKPVLKKLNLKQAVQTLLGRARDLLPFFHSEPAPMVWEEVPKSYQKPELRKLSREQASLVLLGHAGVGHQGAKELIEVVFPEQRNRLEG